MKLKLLQALVLMGTLLGVAGWWWVERRAMALSAASEPVLAVQQGAKPVPPVAETKD